MGQDVLPPRRNQVARAEPAQVNVRVPGVNMGGVIESYFATRHHDRQARAIDALTRHNNSEVALFNAQASVVEADIKLKEKLFALAELPERLGHELALRRVARVESFNQAVHEHKQNELRRETEATYSHADLTRARMVLTDAEQQLQAQREHGYLTYEVAHKKKRLELLDIQLNEAERRAMLKKDFIEESDTASADDIDEALHAYLEVLNAKGLDPSRIEAAIRARKK